MDKQGERRRFSERRKQSRTDRRGEGAGQRPAIGSPSRAPSSCCRPRRKRRLEAELSQERSLDEQPDRRPISTSSRYSSRLPTGSKPTRRGLSNHSETLRGRETESCGKKPNTDKILTLYLSLPTSLPRSKQPQEKKGTNDQVVNESELDEYFNYYLAS